MKRAWRTEPPLAALQWKSQYDIQVCVGRRWLKNLGEGYNYMKDERTNRQAKKIN